MLKLSDFFQPLNFQTLSYFLLLFIFFDVLGTFIKKIIVKPKKDNETRILNWIIGLGFFVFIWFILGFFIPPKGNPVLYSIPLLLVICLPTYIKEKKYLEFPKLLWSLKVPILIILPFLPAVFVKASLPPYYSDEMAYHFLSPSDINRMGVWAFDGGLYQNVPRLFDTFFILIFSITRTYSIVRLFHFSILATSMIFAYSTLKRDFGFWAGFIFVFAFFSIPDEIIFVSTLGFVDIATISFMLIGYLNIFEFVLRREKSALYMSAVFWGMALGTKYTPLTALFVLMIPVVYFVVRERSKFVTALKPRSLMLVAGILLIFGGYWYVKNLVIYGNPTYPFIFPCTRYASEWCGVTSKFFGDWTAKVTIANLKPIMESLFPASRVLLLTIFIMPVFLLFGKNRKIKQISIIITLAIVFEFVVFKFVSGFYARYHQHIQLLMLLLLSVQLGNTYKNKLISFLAAIILIILVIFVGQNYYREIKYYNSLKFLTWPEINYSLGKLDIYGWVGQRLPRMVEALRWCEAPTEGKSTAIARFDPDMIWYEDDGFMRSFLTNCNYENPPLEGIRLEDFYTLTKGGKMQFWTATPNKCMSQEKVAKKHSYEGDRELYLRRLNNLIVCNSTEVKPNLYYFDYDKLK
ncbi:MAG: hypothetical protein NT162_03260 [Candidatus Woesebacteria bacterium]|nr:hypothetical protein [Candidatus Woesebacteria bacterium]